MASPVPGQETCVRDTEGGVDPAYHTTLNVFRSAGRRDRTIDSAMGRPDLRPRR